MSFKMFSVHFQIHQKRQGTNIDLVEQFNIYEVHVFVHLTALL